MSDDYSDWLLLLNGCKLVYWSSSSFFRPSLVRSAKHFDTMDDYRHSSRQDSTFCIPLIANFFFYSLSDSETGLPDFSWYVHDTKTGTKIRNEHKMYQMVIKYPKCLENIPNGH
jgi:hypothetical protein